MFKILVSFRSTNKFHEQILNNIIVTYEGEPDRSEFAKGRIAYKSKTHKAKVCATFMIIAFVVFESLILSLQYLDLAFSLSQNWNESLYWLYNTLKIFNFTITGGWYIAIVVLIAVLNIPILCTILMLMWYNKIKIDTNSRSSTIISIILIFPFFMSFGIFSVPIMKLLLQTYDCKRNYDNIRVLRRFEGLKCESPAQIILFLVALITMLIQLIASMAFLVFTKVEGVFDENGMLLNKKENTDNLNETEVLENTNEDPYKNMGIFSFIFKRQRFK